MTKNRLQEPPLLLLFPSYLDAGKRLAQAAGLAHAEIKIHAFPDGEIRVLLPTQLPPRVIFLQSLNEPNAKLVELLLCAATARELGAKQLMLVAPYLCYMRQDKAFVPGEAVSQTIIGNFLAALFDALITVDPHLHRVRELKDAVPAKFCRCLSAMLPIAHYIEGQFSDPILIGPDEEAEQWVATIARAHGFEYAVANKERRGDREVRISLPNISVQDRHVVLIDDMVSTGQTLADTARALQPLRPRDISAVVTHALFVDSAYENILVSGVARIWSTDSIAHHSNTIYLADMLAQALQEW